MRLEIAFGGVVGASGTISILETGGSERDSTTSPFTRLSSFLF
jgi:hypothetical protein